MFGGQGASISDDHEGERQELNEFRQEIDKVNAQPGVRWCATARGARSRSASM